MGKPKRDGRYVSFKEGYAYPLPMPDLEWKVRYHPNTLTRREMLSVASLMNAYFHMVTSDTQKKRNYVCSEMRKIIDAGDWY